MNNALVNRILQSLELESINHFADKSAAGMARSDFRQMFQHAHLLIPLGTADVDLDCDISMLSCQVSSLPPSSEQSWRWPVITLDRGKTTLLNSPRNPVC